MSSESSAIEETATSKRHGRNPSYNRPLPRRSTKGPLDADDPLAPTSSTLPTSQDDPPHQSTSRAITPVPTQQDFAFLLQPSIYQAIPPPYPPAPPTTTPSQHPRDAFQDARYYSAAMGSAQRLTQPPSPAPEEIFELIYIRLYSLTKLRYLSIAHSESVALGDVNAAFYKNGATGLCLIPWRLRVLVIRLLSDEASDARARQNTLAGLFELAKEARAEYRSCGSARDREQWKRRLSDLALVTVNVLVEGAAYEAALGQLKRMRGQISSGDWVAWMVLIYLRCGDADAAERVLQEAQLPDSQRQHLLAAMVKVCQGQYSEASAVLAVEGVGEDDTAHNNRALANFYTGNLVVCLEILEGRTSGTVPSLESIFNMATCYELMADRDIKSRKEALVDKVGHISGTGKANFHPADFKL